MDFSLLSKIDSPADIKKLDRQELGQLADELRSFMIHTISKTGGHLASSLGTVELTVALHYVFNAPEDQLVWDVGHQAYGHKILTGRRDQFHTLRQYEGISGFPRREESVYDAFNVAHASTSISAALGMAVARDLENKDFHVVAIIGDGGLTGGIALEGINQAGHLQKKLLIILNDNEMSISPNVGAIAGYLNRIVTGQVYNRFKKEVESMLLSVPRIGSRLVQIAKEMVDAMKTFMVPGLLFHELGFDYVGPINGHHLDTLVDTLEKLKQNSAPTILHIVTKKGKGWSVAESAPIKYHGPTAYDPKTGVFYPMPPAPPSYTSVFGKTMIRLAQQDPKVVAITAAMLEGTGLVPFSKEFPDRCFDVGIAEQHGVTFAAGLATQGFKPVAAIYSTFLQRAYDQVIHDVCLMDLPVTFAIDRAGIVGADGPTHNGLYDVAYLRAVPNMIVMAPKDENELQHMIYTAVQTARPAAVRYPRGNGIGVKLDEQFRMLEIGKSEILQDGEDCAILALGTLVYPALKAAERLAADGISASVVNARFVKPLDEDLITCLASEKSFLVTVEEAALMGGFGSAVMELLESKSLQGCKLLRIGIPDRLVPHGSPNLLHAKYGIDADGIYERIKAFVQDHYSPKPGRSRKTSLKTTPAKDR
ncbi:MAG: 1-deoxy-D-xylulose-5-phosphate synthase [Acidimicrobiia bacterium]|nr:1-deoxy-D-xylulose-5-phosphate synthase [Acidimicrobiia bacterium]